MLPAQNQHFGWCPHFFGSPCSLAPMCFPLKISILGSSLHFLWFPVLFFLQSTLCSNFSNFKFQIFWVIPFTCCGSQCCLGPKCFLLKNEHFGWFSSFFMVPSVVWFKYIFHSKSTFLGGSLHFLWFPVLFGFNVFSA